MNYDMKYVSKGFGKRKGSRLSRGISPINLFSLFSQNDTR